MASKTYRRRRIARMWPPAARWSEYLFMLVVRGERSPRKARVLIQEGRPIDWAAQAADAGDADQSHVVRECKQISGRTPTRIVRQAPLDEADWMYRP